MHTLTFHLKTTKAQDDLLWRRFRMDWRIHNQLVAHMQHRLNELERDAKYQGLLQEYIEAAEAVKKAEKAKDRPARVMANKEKKKLSAALTIRRNELGVSKAECEKFVKPMQNRFKDHISSQQAQKEADFVWNGVEKVLFGNGKHIHFKRLNDQHSIQQKCATNGAKWKDGIVDYLGMEIRADVPDDPYVAESLNHDIKYCILTREMFESGWRYYVVLYLDGPAPEKLVPAEGTTAIDPGMSTMCCVGQDAMMFYELAPECKRYNEAIAREQAKIDRQMRQANPGNYDADGRVKRGRHKWVVTKECRRRKRRVTTLYRKKAAATENSHNRQLNELIGQSGNSFIVEHMDYAALGKRSKKKAERQDKASRVKTKDGEKAVRKFKRKRRFGASLRDRAPSSFLTRAQQKAVQYGGTYAEIDTKSFKASQLDHTTGELKKIPLSQRTKVVDGHEVLRDAYSAFLIFCSNPEGTEPDIDLCNSFFERFLRMEDAMVAFLRGSPHPACFGF